MDHLEAGCHWDENADVWTMLSRAGYDVCRDYVNTPAFLEMLPNVTGLRGLDIGCGECHNTRLVAERGAHMTALDLSRRFLGHAAETEARRRQGIRFVNGSAVHLPFAEAAFDFVVSFMCFMDVPETGAVLAEAFRVIKPGGFLQFSITHPCFDLPWRKKIRDANGRSVAYELGGYFERTEGDILEWLFSAAPPQVREGLRRFRTPIFRRTLSEWMNTLVSVGFVFEHMEEPRSGEKVIQQRPELDDMDVIPFFMILRCRKPASAENRPGGCH
jgi:ubiquinone/menaquinone biosynthesis C-methylase UbiE